MTVEIYYKNKKRHAVLPDGDSAIAGLLGFGRCTAGDLKKQIPKIVDMTLCSGSLGSNPDNDIPAFIREFGAQGRIHFAHVRNIKFTGPGQLKETSHFSADGSLDLYKIMKAYYDVGFNGYVHPDRGRMIWDEKGRPGYGLYDRALGVSYLNGLWEAVEKGHR